LQVAGFPFENPFEEPGTGIVTRFISLALIPAFSPGEKEKGIQLFEEPSAGIIARLSKNLKTWRRTPSPGGEGRGEGECKVPNFQ
jgi:hypothetical protein